MKPAVLGSSNVFAHITLFSILPNSSSKRPERLISKLKTMNMEDAARGGKKIVVIRQPRGPEGMGFKATRNV